MFTRGRLRTSSGWTYLGGVVLHVELHLELVLVVAHFRLWAHVGLPGLQRHVAPVHTGSSRHQTRGGKGRGEGLSGRGGKDGGDPWEGVEVCETRGDSEAGVEVAELPLLLLNPPVESRLWPLAGVARAACW